MEDFKQEETKTNCCQDAHVDGDAQGQSTSCGDHHQDESIDASSAGCCGQDREGCGCGCGCSGRSDDGASQRVQEAMEALNDKYIRLYAEFENYRKRTIKERQAYEQHSQERIFRELLPIIDDFERSLSAKQALGGDAASQAIDQGVVLIYNKCQSLLKQFGVQEVDIKVGQDFDDQTSEAVMKKPVENGEKVGSIIQVVEKGYMLNGSMIRYAKVVIGV